MGFSAPAFAQSAGSFAGAFSNAYLIPTQVCQAGTTTLGSTGALTCNGGQSTGALLASNIKLPNGASDKMVLIMASLQDAITTDTQVTGGGGKQSATASGSIVVTPSICLTGAVPAQCNLAPIYPSSVTFYAQKQQLTANLSGCITNSSTTGPVVSCTTPESIELLLSITTANSFNFLVDNSSLGSGVYTVEFGVNATTNASATSLLAGATVDLDVGAGSLGALVVQAQTPFNTISLCSPSASTVDGPPNPCGP